MRKEDGAPDYFIPTSSQQRKFAKEWNEQTSRSKRVSERYNFLVQSIDTRMATKKQEIAEGKKVVEIAYRGDTVVYDFFPMLRELMKLQPEVEKFEEGGLMKVDWNGTKNQESLFQHKVHGVAIEDIETMEIDRETGFLDPEDIKKINKFFQTSRFTRNRGGKFKEDRDAQEWLTFFAVQKTAQSTQEIPLPRTEKKLYENITNYFDFYTQLITRRQLSFDEELACMNMISKAVYNLPTAIAIYYPGKLNISPSSAIKLFQQRAVFASDSALRFSWKQLETVVIPILKEAYREDAFPENLQVYQHYDQAADRRATDQLIEYQITHPLTKKEQLEILDGRKEQKDQFGATQKALRLAINQEKNKQLTYTPDTNLPLDQITTFRNNDSFVFIIHLQGNTHLTLELDKEMNLYGVPPELVKAYPHMPNLLLKTLLQPFMKEDAVPDNRSGDKTQQRVAVFKEPQTAEKIGKEEGIFAEEEEQSDKPLKRKHHVSHVIFSEEPTPVLPYEGQFKEKIVAYSEAEIRELLGKNITHNEDVVDAVYAAISSFEAGNKPAVQVKMYKGEVVRIRAGQYRILLDRQGNGNYSLREITNRKDAYK